MTITVTHAFVSGIADDPKAAAAGEVLPSHWNASHVVSGSTGRDTLLADRNYFVSTTGSDSHGGTNSTTDAWATLQHAIDFTSSSIDFAGFTVTVNVGAGSFAGFGIKSCVGGGIIQFVGAGTGSTTITNGPNDGIYNFGECVKLNVLCTTVIAVNKVTLAQTGGSFIGIAQPGFFFYLGDPTSANLTDVALDCTTASANSRLIDNESFSVIQDAGGSTTGTVTIIGANQTIGFCFLLLGGGQFFHLSSWVFSGNLTINQGTVNIQDGGQFIAAGGSMSGGGVTAARFNISGSGFADVADSAGTFFVGNTSGILTSGGQYTGISDYNGNVAGLPTATVKGAKAFVTDALGPTFGAVVAGGGGVYTPVYADGTNWRCG